LAPEYEQPVHTPSLPWAINVNVDGTLAQNNGTSGLYEWKRVGEDEVDETIADIVRLFDTLSTDIIAISGRPDVCQQETK
jgi:hypothetical protein